MRGTKGRHGLGHIVVLALSVWTGCSDSSPGDGDGGPGTGSGDGGAGSGGDGGSAELARCVERSGTRLKRVVLDHGGEDADLVRFIDTDYGEAPCTFGQAADGAFRCLPVGTDTAVFTTALRLWTDAGCSNQIGQVSFEGNPTSFVVYEFPNYGPCPSPGSGTRFHQAGTRLPYNGTETVYEKDPNGACVATTASFNRSYYTFGAEIPASSFVAAEEVHSSDGRLSVRSAEGEDGSRFCDHTTLRDTERDESCSPQIAEDGTYHCLPPSIFPSTFYTDGTCASGTTVGTAQLSECAATNFKYINETVSSSCGRRIIHERGAVLGGQFYYLAGTCNALESPYQVHAMGPLVPASEFVPFVQELPSVGGRLRRLDLVGDGVRIHRDVWYDPELESACWFRRTEGSAWRCVPVGRPSAPVPSRSALRTAYADAACTLSVQAVQEDCSGVAPKYLVDTGDSSRVYPVGTAFAQVYQKGASCTPMTGTWYQLGPALSFDDLVLAEEAIRPDEIPTGQSR